MAPSWIVLPWYEFEVVVPVELAPPQAASASAKAIAIPRATFLIELLPPSPRFFTPERGPIPVSGNLRQAYRATHWRGGQGSSPGHDSPATRLGSHLEASPKCLHPVPHVLQTGAAPCDPWVEA